MPALASGRGVADLVLVARPFEAERTSYQSDTRAHVWHRLTAGRKVGHVLSICLQKQQVFIYGGS